MEATPRMKQIFQILLKEKHAVSLSYLANQIGVSKRTVQRELAYSSRCLRGYDLRFQSKTGVGVWLEGSDQEKNRLLGEIESEDDFDASDRQGRRRRLVLEILKDKGLKKLFYYSSQFGVSEATISGDLEAVETWLNRYGLTVSRKPGSGVSVEGSEEDYRRAIRAYISENVKKSKLGQILDDNMMERVMECVAGMDDDNVLTMTESSYIGLIIHITIAVKRIQMDEVIEEDERWRETVKNDEDYRLARQIVKRLEQEFAIEIPAVEVAYICLHIKGAKHEKIKWEDHALYEMENRQIQQLVNRMVDAFDADKAYLLKQDNEFIQGLLAHLKPTFIRLVHGMHITNPVLAEIRDSYPLIFQKCRDVALVIEDAVKKPVPEEEIGFLAVHFGAAVVRLEEQSEKIRRVHVGVVCSSGIGISRLMSIKLMNAFRSRIQITTYGKHDITAAVRGQQDFFISSIPMGETEGVPVISVSPLITEGDLEKIRRMVYQYERMPKKQKADDDFTLQLETIHLVASQINAILKHMEFFKVDNKITFEELLIAVGEKFSPDQERRVLIREDLLRREQIATQVYAEFGFALLHTRTKGVVRPEFGVCVTKDLKAFEAPCWKGIKAVFVMLVPIDGNLQANSQIMGRISGMLVEDAAFLDVVAKGQKEEIKSALSKNLKKYFHEFVAGLT